MNARVLLQTAVCALAAVVLAGCVASQPYDYTSYRLHPPRSILVLPPLNESVAVEATYSYLSTVSRPLAELGYYVYPVAVVDAFLKENGLPTAGEMHEVPLNKVLEVVGADSVLYVVVQQYGSKYQVVNSATLVQVKGKLVDTRTGIVLWEGIGFAQQNSGGSGNILGDLIAAALTQAINSSTDQAHALCPAANVNMLCTKDHGLLPGPYNPDFGKTQ